MTQPTIEQRLEAAEYRIKILTELLYRVVNSNEVVLSGLDKASYRALFKMYDGYSLDSICYSLNDYDSGYKFNHKLGDTNE